MPGVLETPRSSSPSSSNENLGYQSPSSHIRDAYPAASIPGYSEKPLNEQLEPIAVVGMGCRLPGDVSSATEFWDMLMTKKSGQTPKVPANRFNIDAHYHKNRERPGSFPVLGGYFIKEDLENFDPGPFNIAPIEAMWMDPQQRKLLEVVYEALESGGISLDAISGTRTGVFAASFTSDWQQMAFKEQSFRHTMSATGVDPGILSDRISYVFNLNGPSILCNTACSSSIYALHQACVALRDNECDGALVGGTNLVFTVDQQMNTAKIGVLSPRSTCFTFDESADGYGRAEGVGAVYLKRLSDAVRDGDPIRAVLRGSAVNHNGKASSASISYPGVDGQAYVMAQAYKRGGDLDPLLTGYFECHGTGTAVGDPIEVEAISIAMNRNRRRGVDDPLMIGAAKTNIGHGEAASGLSALIKAILIVERGIIPPTIGIKKLSSKIKWDEWQVQVPVEPTPFPSHLPVRRVSVNTCGYGGTNAHVIVEEAQSILRGPQIYKYVDEHARGGKLSAPRRTVPWKRPFLLPFSAHDKTSLRRNIEAHAKCIDKYDLLDLSYTLGCRRTMHASKAFTVTSHRALKSTFADIDSSFTFAEKKRGPPTVGFVFTGQGSQWPRMGAELIDYSQRFLVSIRAMDRALDELKDGPDWSIEGILLEHEDMSPIHEAEYAQPLCTAVQIALVDLLADWGVRPVVTVGHSSGEMAAAYAAGLISLETAITAAYYRGKVARDVREGGAMMAVGLGAEAVEPYLSDLKGKVVLACHNSPSGVTLSGDADALQNLKTKFDAENIFARFLKTSGKAYHSHYMAPVADKYECLFRAALEYTSFGLVEQLTGVKMVSSVTNSILPETTVLDEKYWSANLRSPVLFNQAVQTILASEEFASVDLLIEVGPHSAMSGPIKQIKTLLQAEALDYLPTLLRDSDSATRMLSLAGDLYLRSHPMKMERVASAFVPQEKGSVIVDLPRYQWNYSRQFWPESRASREHRRSTHPRHDILGQRVIGSSVCEPTWRNILRIRDLPWLKHHSLGGEAVFPAAGYFSAAVEAVTQINEWRDDPMNVESYVLRDISIKKALVTPDTDDGIEVLTNLRPSVFGSDWWDFSVSSIDTENITREHMSGTVSINTAPPRGSKKPRKEPQFPQRASGKAWNQALRDVGFDYGATFQDMDNIKFDGKNFEASCSTTIKQQVDASLGESRHVLHPASVDSTLQLSIVAIYAGRTNAMDCGVVPVQVDEVTIWPPTKEQVETAKANAYAWVDRRGIRSFENSVQLTADNGEMVMEIVNVRTTSYEAAVPQKDETALKPAPYGEMVWELDIDSLDGTNTKGLTAVDLTNLVLFKYPSMKVLGTDTTIAKSILQKNPQARYTVTVSDGMGGETSAKSSIEQYSNAKVTSFDPSQDLESQSLTSGSYDVVVATTNVLHLLQPLVKPGGFLVRVDDATIQKVASPEEMTASSAAMKSDHQIQLVYRTRPGPIISLVKTKLESLGWRVSTCNLQACTEPGFAAGHVIMLGDFESPVLASPSEGEFLAIQSITNSASSLLWATNGGLLKGRYPEHAMASGLARSVTSEQASLDFRTLDFDPDTVQESLIVESIARVAQLQFAKSEEVPEREFCVADDKTYISRLVRNDGLNAMFAVHDEPEEMNFTPGDRISGKVLHGKVVFEKQNADSVVDNVKAGRVEVQLTCAGLTKEGVMVITGSDYPTTFSHEIGGVVTKVGAGVTNLQPGDKVIGLNVDQYASYQQVPATMLYKIDSKDCMSTAVSMLMAYATALYAFHSLTMLRANEKVLILHKTGISGAAVAKLAQAKGAIPYVQVGTDEEAVFVQKHLGLSREQVILPSHGPIAARISQLTNGHGADVVFSDGSTVDPTVAHEAWRCIAQFGRFVDAGRKDVLSRSALDPVPLRRGALYLPFDMLDLLQARPELIAEFLPTVVDMLRNGDNRAPGLVNEINLANLNEAVSNFSSSFDAITPIVQYAASETPIQVIPPKKDKLQFNPDVTYLLVGCLGGLGRSLTSWMMESGARRFAFLSRSGADAPSAAKLVKDIETAGAIVQVVRGDATNRTDVVRAVNEVPIAHPIRGVVHAAMVLRDGMFHSMSYKNWTTAVSPKVLGAMNLHSVLSSTPLDFFLMTSSVSGILGTPGQSNYAAANSYLDSLARHRIARNLAATSCVIPMVLGVGVVSESTEIEDSLRRKGMYGIDEENLLQAFEAGISTNLIEPKPDHVVAGLDPALLQKAVADEAATDSFWLEDARFSHAAHAIQSSKESGGGAGGQSVLAMIKGAATPAVAGAIAAEHFAEKLARMLLLPRDEVDPDSGSIASYGIDSMIGAELRNWIFKEYRFDIPFQQLLAPTLTINKFAKQVCEEFGQA
ncbi:KR domain-containing protein [Biscogniauxia marginata]|nr:KR domain-containing protein [Biscogniauxia marginata]